MFDGLRKKLSEAVKGFIKKEGPQIEEEAKAAPMPQPVPVQEPKPQMEKQQERVERPEVVEKVKPPEPETVIKKSEMQPPRIEPKPEEKPEAPREERRERKEEKGEEKKEKEFKLSLKTKVKSVFTSTVVLNENEINDFLEAVKMSMLQSDVSFDTTEQIIDDLRGMLGSARIDSRHIEKGLESHVRKALLDTLNRSKQGVDLFPLIKERVQSNAVPVKILFLGPNGTGKTTTMAKIAYHLKKNGISSVLSASDTFRAAAIEQTEYHANKVGVPVIKSKYGADPASIAFDAIAYAKARGINVVLIDSAGRQETNKNLINEMQKMVRVASPDIVLFVGESTAGNALSEQISEFSKFMKIDGIILTKLDCDAKGGNAISIAHVTGIPILFFGVGEAYDALMPYSADFILNAIMPEDNT
jgi:fused signal recognition particle receptor